MIANERGQCWPSRRPRLPYGLLADAVQIHEMREHFIGRHAEVDQTRDLVHARLTKPLREVEAPLRSSKQPTRLEVALEREVEQGLHVLWRQRVEFISGQPRLGLAPGAPRGPCPSEPFDQAHRAAQVLLHRLPHRLAYGRVVNPNERVQHERDASWSGVSRLLARVTVD